MFEYTGDFGDHQVSFNRLELINGATRLFILFGVDPSSAIINIKYRRKSV